MKGSFKSFIRSLNDHELAVYLSHQGESLLSYSKEIVKNEIELRQLTRKQLDEYRHERLTYIEPGPFCEKCGSNKHFIDKEKKIKGGQYKISEVEVQTMRCRLCYYNPSTAPEKNIFKRIKRFFFDKNKVEKVVKTYDWLDDFSI